MNKIIRPKSISAKTPLPVDIASMHLVSAHNSTGFYSRALKCLSTNRPGKAMQVLLTTKYGSREVSNTIRAVRKKNPKLSEIELMELVWLTLEPRKHPHF